MFDNSSLVIFQFYHSQFESNIGRLARQLTCYEKSEISHFKNTEKSINFIISRYFSRLLLGKFNNVESSEISYALGEFGKPVALDSSSSPLRVQFNISHSNKMCLLAFSKAAGLGVDVEFVDGSIDINELALVYFAMNERRCLEGLQGQALIVEFYRLWTLKEAYLKSIGVGLNVDLSEISSVDIMSSGSRLLDTLDLDNSNYQAAIACNNGSIAVNSLSADESHAFIDGLL